MNPWRRTLRVASGILLLTFSGGCVGISGSLATSTGARRGGTWSEAGHQAAHVGENVQFSFIFKKPFAKAPVHPAGLAEYAVLQVDDRPLEMELDSGGRFTASYRMPTDWQNREFRIRATAYRQYGQRDRIVVSGKWLESDRTADPGDQVIAADAITMLVYQSSIEFTIPPEADDLDFNAAHLVVRKSDGTASTVPKSGSGIAGFRVEGPSAMGEFTVRYEPPSVQVNSAGRTEAELTVHDSAGRPHRYRADFMTP